ncbi:FliH/SctL family protein [Cereibacter sphaeroides f. sp. denitrificans]|nr:flagellar assembly protein FliH [Cereibacter sphaeroides f. sp. denitrificans]
MTAQTPIGPEDVLALIRETNARGFGRSDLPAPGPEGPFRPMPLSGLGRATAPEGLRPPEAVEPVPEGQGPGPSALVPPDPAPALPDPALLEAARAEGRREGHAEGWAEGRAEGRREAEAEFALARETFLRLAARLSAPTPGDTARLARMIDGTVCALASQRAGIAIDAHPAGFAARIEALADRVAQGLRQVTLRLNPEDLQALAPHLPGSDLLSEARVAPDPCLARGDLEVRAEGILLSDLLAPAASQPQDTATAPGATDAPARPGAADSPGASVAGARAAAAEPVR